MKRMLLLLTYLLLSTFGFAQLNPGDIVIIGFSGDTSPGGGGTGKSFTFVPLVDLPAGTVINFTDSGWLGTSFRANEGGAIYTAPAGGITAGTVITASGTTNATWAANGTEWTAPPAGVGNNGMNFSTDGDQILVYTGDATMLPVTFIFAVNGASTGFSAPANADDANRTALPTGLTEGTNAVAVGAGAGDEDEYDNVYYNGITTGTRDEILAAVTDPANWEGNNTNYSPITSNFTITSPCTLPTITSLSLNQPSYCPGEDITLTVDGMLNDADEWVVYVGSCGGTNVTESTSSVIDLGSLANFGTTTIYVRGEGACIETPGACTPIDILVEGTPATITSLSLDQPSYLPGESITLTVDGMLNDADEWVVYRNNCGGLMVVSDASSTIDLGSLNTLGITTIYVRGEGACIETPGNCTEIDILVEEAPTCSDGIQNGDEEGVDCGGSNCPPCQPDFDCPILMADIGDPCDDFDPDTENDMVDSDCDCVGTPVVASEIDLTLDADNTTAACGETVTVEVDISDYMDIASLSFSINFDPSELEYVSYEEITLDGETPIVGEPGVGDVPSNALTYTWFSGGFSGSSGSAQTILRIEFVMLLNAGMTTVTISDDPTTIEAADGNTFASITVNVGPDLTLSGDAPAPPTCPNNLTVCIGDALVDLTMLTPGANPAGGTFSGDDVRNNSFNPATAGEGMHTIMYEYTNDQGCTTSCEFEIMVISCQPEISVTDPCSCKNNATTLDNGQFDEFVSLVAPSGQTWTVTAVSGLFSAASPAPPAAPVDNLLGASLTETDNGDGTSTYRIDGIHVDGAGFEITVSNGSASGSVGNTCYYPNPEIAGLDDSYCEDDDRQITLSGTVDRGDGMSAATPDAETFAIFDGVNPVLDPATMLQPSALGVGLYTVRYTVDATDEGSSEESPNQFVGFPGCVQSVTQTVQIDPQVLINPLQTQTICSVKRLALAEVFDGIGYAGDASELVYTWSLLEADADGTLSNTNPGDPTAGTYTPGTNDAKRGSVTLVLAVDNPNDACEAVQAQVSITIEKVGCGGFPWSGKTN